MLSIRSVAGFFVSVYTIYVEPYPTCIPEEISISPTISLYEDYTIGGIVGHHGLALILVASLGVFPCQGTHLALFVVSIMSMTYTPLMCPAEAVPKDPGKS